MDMGERDLKIIKLYNDGLKPDEICSECGCSIGTIYNALKRNNIGTRAHKQILKEDVKREIIDRYKNNESIWAISKRVGIGVEKIKEVLSGSDVESISYAKRLNPDLKENFFENIDTPEKAYWLGWMITDGCISKGNTISICLQKRDLPILDRFQHDLGLDGKIKVFNKDYYRFSFCCKKMVEDLSRYGVVPNKTFTVRLPEVSKELVPHLLRGCLEGDGGITKSKRNGKYVYEMAFCGNYDCVSDFNNYLSLITDIKPKNIVKSNSIFRVRWSSVNEIIQIMEILYSGDEEHRMDRKYNFLNEIKSL